MPKQEPDSIRDSFLEAAEASLGAQLRAVRRLRHGPAERPKRGPRSREGMSQVDLVEDILRRAGAELHISEIIDRVKKTHGVSLDRESIASALSKKVQRGDRFVRTGKNVFALKQGGR